MPGLTHAVILPCSLLPAHCFSEVECVSQMASPGLPSVWVWMETFVTRARSQDPKWGFSCNLKDAFSPKEELRPSTYVSPFMYSTELLSQCLRPHDGSSSKPDHSISCGFHYISLYRTRKAQGELLLCHYLSDKQRFQQVCGSTKVINTRPKCHQRFLYEDLSLHQDDCSGYFW